MWKALLIFILVANAATLNPSLTVTVEEEPAPAPAPSGGGGGGGGIIFIQPSVIFKGKAYPGSSVTLLKDAQVAATTKAGPDANFEIGLAGLSGGTYNFGVWATDYQGNRSITHTFTITISPGATATVSGIFVPPTISVDKQEVRRGDILNILGQSAPEARVNVLISSERELVKETKADAGGAWLYKFDTLEVDFGDHAARARASQKDDFTTFSQLVFFKVGTKTVAKVKDEIIRGDSNNDGRINLVDFSIAAFWYKRALPSPPSVDLNRDGIVDLIDFSIMAFYWTG